MTDRAKKTLQHGEPRAFSVCLGDVEPEEATFLWDPYIPLGKLTLLEGDPGVGKTFIALTLAAIVSRGWPFPDQEGHVTSDLRGTPAPVLYFTAEDGIADTLRPRLDAADADVAMIHAITHCIETIEGETIKRPVTLKDDKVLNEVFEEYRPRLVFVDPLQAFLAPGVDMNKANEVRPGLRILGDLAEKHQCAVIAIRHLAKGGRGRAIYSGLGSIDFAAAARSILLAGEYEGDKVLAHTKSNLAPFGRSQRFAIENGAAEWLGSSDVVADDIIRFGGSASNSSALAEAVTFLRGILAAGPVSVKRLKNAAEDADLSWRTVERGKKELEVKSERTRSENGTTQEWQWRLP